jgi:pimeloyl-ACP methyl ester carboxylesterase
VVRVRPLLAAALLLTGCSFFAPTVSVKRAGPDAVYESLNQNVLNSDQLSTATLEVLRTFDLDELADDDPIEGLRRLHAVALKEPTRVNLFALSELAYHAARSYDDRDAYLASAIYAWFYLLGNDGEPPSPYDRRFRWACDLYNGGLQRAFEQKGSEYLVFDKAERTLPVGRVTVALDTSRTPWDDAQIRSYLPGDDYLIKGLSLRLRDAGLGVPLVGVRNDGRPGAAPATGFLRVHGTLADMEQGLSATIELHSAYDTPEVQVDDHTVPLESDLSVMLALGLHESPLWKFSLSGLFQGNSAVTENRLRTVMPPAPGRIPVIFVHGTASNPAYWADMFNTLLADPDLRANMQFWFFQYASGNPILYSAMTLREQLAKVLADADPLGSDPALHHVILVGHSQGGLIVRLMICDGSLEWLQLNTGHSLEELKLDEKTDALLRSAFAFKALPQVDCAVFLATPHQGSFMADSWYSRFMSRFISLPAQLQIGFSRPDLPDQFDGRTLPTALDNMDPASHLLQRLAQTPISPAVRLHSIICVGDADVNDPAQLAEADDGVVKYQSAHLQGVDSELLVNCQHSCQDNPLVIQEVRRILREELARYRGSKQP